MSKKKVLVSSRSFGQIVDIGNEILTREKFQIERILPEDRPVTEEKLHNLISRGDIVAIVSGSEAIGSKALEDVGRLRVISKHGVGVDNIDLDVATERGVVVTNAPGTNTQAVADFTIGLMLCLSRKICLANQSTTSGKWKKFIGRELWQKTVGVIGTGAIGKHVIRRLKGFDVKILAYDIEIDTNFASKYGVNYVSLAHLLKESDYVTLHVPLTKATEGMIGRKELGQMKRSSYLINAARGEIVDEDALYHALQAGEIAGAALDVFATEPPQRQNLLDLDNLIATPHMAAYTYRAMMRMDKLCAENIVKVIKGERSEHTVNPEVFSKLETF
jgi:D-3-phosphoglycerate dehydrogenase